MLPSQQFRLIPAVPIDRNRVAAAFEALATRIQKRDRCDRVTPCSARLTRIPSGSTNTAVQWGNKTAHAYRLCSKGAPPPDLG
jgi:hypothetical protein